MNTLLLSLAMLAPMADPVKTPPAGVLPIGTDGKSLNFDFETGTLKDWTIEGEAFKDQPIEGDTVSARRGDMKSAHQGKYWIGGYEKHADKPIGTLTSVEFKVTHPWASFLIAGGNHPNEIKVELLNAKKEVFYKATGDESEELKRVAVDLAKYQGQTIQIRLVDTHTGHWGHLNFDDFRFHSEKPKVADVAIAKDNLYPYSGQKPEDAAKNMKVPPGFSVKLFAGEPDLHQPIAMCFDDRGRLWVIEAYCYPKRHAEKGPVIPSPLVGEGGRRPGEGGTGRPGDKILIFEDTDGDGKFDKRTVFFEGLNLASGIEYGFGGIWVGAAPYFLFIPIDPKTEKAGEPKILLDGWGYEDTHETLNSFIWGPDGWLYGCHGVFTHSNVGKPGAAKKDRAPLNAGVWRYHPTKHIFEVFAHGISNPWGLDYNQYGDFFAEACVIPHLWHVVQGGRYQRQAGSHFNPYTYDDIKTIAKHRHFVGGQWNDADRLKSDDLGGGHAHSGLLCYQGGLWPKEYHGKLLMGNIHGHRINVDEVKPKGSSYEGDRNPDFLLSGDKHCIIVNIQAGPDGNVFFSDWSDKQVCHTNDAAIWDRTNGRVFKIEYKDTKPLKSFDLQKLSDEELVKLQTSDNEWMVRHARRILQERSVTRDMKASVEVEKLLEKMFDEDKSEVVQLRALWALHNIFPDQLMNASVDKSAYVRAYRDLFSMEETARFASNGGPIDILERDIKGKDFAITPIERRLMLAWMLRLPLNLGMERLKLFLQHAEDAADPILPHLYWYALEPLCVSDSANALKIAAGGKIPQLVENASRRIGAIATPAASEVLVHAISESKTPEHALAYLHGLQESIKGIRTAEAPKGWAEVYAKLETNENADVKQVALSLAVVYGDVKALEMLLGKLMNVKESLSTRKAALASLVDVRYRPLPTYFQILLADSAVRTETIRAVAAFEDEDAPGWLIHLYPELNTGDKLEAIAALASRVSYATKLLAATEEKKIPSTDIPAETIRQLRNLNSKALNEKIAAVWGVIRDTPLERKKLINDWAGKLKSTAIATADPQAGRTIFNKVCAQCHVLYGTGGKVGPEITGANRADLNYLLENIFDPSAVIPKEYAAMKFDLLDGRVVTGILKAETAAVVTVQTANEILQIPVKDVDKRSPSNLSMMPDDLTKPMTDRDVRNLISYLQTKTQVPALLDAEGAKGFFNGKDLLNFDGDKEVWSVDNGEIVGKTEKGLKKNTFLKSNSAVADFKLTLKVKLAPNKENSGIQFRSEPIEGGEMRGPQADIGATWWGKLYEESARGLLVKNDNDKHVKVDDWNDYVVEAIGPKVKIWINGQLICDYEDDKLSKRGLIGFQVHSGGPMEVRFKEIKLEVIETKGK